MRHCAQEREEVPAAAHVGSFLGFPKAPRETSDVVRSHALRWEMEQGWISAEPGAAPSGEVIISC